MSYLLLFVLWKMTSKLLLNRQENASSVSLALVGKLYRIGSCLIGFAIMNFSLMVTDHNFHHSEYVSAACLGMFSDFQR